MTPFQVDPKSARQSILETIPDSTSLHGRPPEVRFSYVPASHAKALDLDTQVVVGMRGTGKSFWWTALQSAEHRSLLAQRSSQLGIVENASIAAGFGEEPQPDWYPQRDVLRQLLDSKFEPRLIWRTVILQALAGGDTQVVGSGRSWADRVTHVKQQPEWIERFLYDRDRAFESEGKSWVILFDALDRTASDWPTMNELVRGLLQAVLDLRPYRRLRAKCFLRTDQLNESEVATFPDASKLMAEKAELDWPANELYGLLFQYMGNARDGAFRKAIESESWFKWPQIEGTDESVAWLPPSSLRHDAELQRRVVHTITGPWMGRDRRRGDPYTWIPNHLADSQGKTSPRSFLAALRHAADETSKQYPEHEYALHYESIKRGVQKASEIRVRELREDYPWVDTLMKPLRGKVVPCDFAEIESVWDEVLMELRSRVEQQVERLPPAQLAAGAEGVRRDLENLGIFFRIKDGRVNVPDVYRLSYNIGRKGGVPPVRRASAG